MLIDIFFPKICQICSKNIATGDLCSQCQQTLPLIRMPACKYCAMPLGPYSPIDQCLIHNADTGFLAETRAAGCYRGALKDMILRFKFCNDVGLRLSLAHLLYQQIKKQPFAVKPDMITAVPMSPKSLRKRGYNQSQLLAATLSKKAKIAHEPDLLRKRKETPPQAGLKRKERQRNLQGAFLVPPKAEQKLKGKTILIIDDIFTTGSTLQKCCAALKKAGAKTIYAGVIARATIK